MLSEILNLNIFHVLLVFVRLSAAFMLLPGFSAHYINMKSRLLLAVAITLIITPIVSPQLPAAPSQMSVLVLLIVLETFYGAFFGLVTQAVMGAMHLAGTSIGQMTGLMNAMVFDPITEQQGAMVVGALSNIILVSLFVMDLHHLMIQGVVASYALFPVGSTPLVEDHLVSFLDIFARSFAIGLQMSAPFIVAGILFQVALGLMARLSPQMNVFFVALPLQILLGLAMLWVALPGLILIFLRYFEGTLTAFIFG
ncbi:flagellar biosynthetic protein FliR [Novispirillum itersonii]|uniref:flagellar biosynthetic protein FliR n=1 Tax=Novispirillum itersonii TaxID=189 RepID=UPI0003717AD5|nr:flagellar biosynthetic protein FliR [Novispirillum itersonii]